MKAESYFQWGMSLKWGFWIDHHSILIDMNDVQLVTLERLRGFLAGAVDLRITPTADAVARYGHVKSVLKRFKYPQQSKDHRGLIRRYLRRVTGCSRPHLSRLIAQYLHSGRAVRYRATTTSHARKFTPEDVMLLAGARQPARHALRPSHPGVAAARLPPLWPGEL